MQALPGRPDFDAIAQRWHDLAQRRLAYYTELYRSGRWRRYYTQDRFAVRMLDVIRAADDWSGLVSRAHELTARMRRPKQAEPLDDKLRSAA